MLLATCAASAEELRCKVVGVARGADIPASQLDAARNFVAAYALEGEWLPAETSLQPGSTCTKSQTRPVSDYPLSLWDQLDPIRKHLPKPAAIWMRATAVLGYPTTADRAFLASCWLT